MFWRGKRKYTGYDYTSKGRRAGTTKLINWIIFLNKGKFRNLGSWTVRDMRGKPGKQSVHATGRAFDLGFKNYEDVRALCDFLTRHWEAFGIEAIIDYYLARLVGAGVVTVYVGLITKSAPLLVRLVVSGFTLRSLTRWQTTLLTSMRCSNVCWLPLRGSCLTDLLRRSSPSPCRWSEQWHGLVTSY